MTRRKRRRASAISAVFTEPHDTRSLSSRRRAARDKLDDPRDANHANASAAHSEPFDHPDFIFEPKIDGACVWLR